MDLCLWGSGRWGPRLSWAGGTLTWGPAPCPLGPRPLPDPGALAAGEVAPESWCRHCSGGSLASTPPTAASGQDPTLCTEASSPTPDPHSLSSAHGRAQPPTQRGGRRDTGRWAAPPAGPVPPPTEPVVLTVAPLPSRPPSGPINSFGSLHLPPVSVSQPFGSPQVRGPRRLRANIRGRGPAGSGHVSGSCHDEEAGRAPCTEGSGLRGPAAHTRHVPVHTGRHTCTHACAHACTPHTHKHVCAYTCSAHVGPHPASTSTRTCANTHKSKGICTWAHVGRSAHTHMDSHSHRHTGTRVLMQRTHAHTQETALSGGSGSSWARGAALTVCTAQAAPEPSCAPTPLSDTVTAPLTQGGLGGKQSAASRGLEKTLVLASAWPLPAVARSPHSRRGCGPGPDQPQAFSPRQAGRPAWRTPARVPASGASSLLPHPRTRAGMRGRRRGRPLPGQSACRASCSRSPCWLPDATLPVSPCHWLCPAAPNPACGPTAFVHGWHSSLVPRCGPHSTCWGWKSTTHLTLNAPATTRLAGGLDVAPKTS